MSAADDIRDVFGELENIISRLEDELEEARDAGYREGEKDGIKAGEQLVDQLVRDLIEDVDRRRRQAELPVPLCPGYMTLDQVEKMIRKVAER